MRIAIAGRLDTVLPITAFLADYPDFEVAGACSTASELQQIVSATDLDAIVLDLALEDGDALSVLDSLKTWGAGPTTVVLSSIMHDRLLRALSTAGATYVLAKPIDPALLADRLRRLVDQRGAASSPAASVEREISRLLTRVGVPTHLLGHRYVQMAITLAVKNEPLVHAITKELYPVVAREYATTPVRVERTIRHAIEVAWTRGQPEYLYGLFGKTIRSDRGRPSNSEFIAHLADHVRQVTTRIVSHPVASAGS